MDKSKMIGKLEALFSMLDAYLMSEKLNERTPLADSVKAVFATYQNEVANCIQQLRCDERDPVRLKEAQELLDRKAGVVWLAKELLGLNAN